MVDSNGWGENSNENLCEKLPREERFGFREVKRMGIIDLYKKKRSLVCRLALTAKK